MMKDYHKLLNSTVDRVMVYPSIKEGNYGFSKDYCPLLMRGAVYKTMEILNPLRGIFLEIDFNLRASL
jgi:hypothetical protein